MEFYLEDDNYLRIQLLSYDCPKESLGRLYLMEMSTLQATTLVPANVKITNIEIIAYTNDNTYLTEDEKQRFKTIGDLNSFFLQNPHYYIDGCDLELESGITIHYHDATEISITFRKENIENDLVNNIFTKYQLNKQLIKILVSKPGHYIAIDESSEIIGDYANFDEYIEKGRK
ncbi:MAG: hypothetical protein ACXWEY_07865 [Bacteroidia bacterium]